VWICHRLSAVWSFSYASLWHFEHAQGREEGVKNRPCVIVLAVERTGSNRVVTVVPVTHSVPSHPDEAVEIPMTTKRRLGLDDARSWILVSEANSFVRPGPDLHSIAPERFDYGFLPRPCSSRCRRGWVATSPQGGC